MLLHEGANVRIPTSLNCAPVQFHEMRFRKCKFVITELRTINLLIDGERWTLLGNQSATNPVTVCTGDAV